jgi:hypothetical protein
MNSPLYLPVKAAHGIQKVRYCLKVPHSSTDKSKRLISVSGSATVHLPEEHKGKAVRLLKFLEESGFELTKEMNGNFLVAIDHNENQYRQYIKNGGNPKKAILIRLEPISVFPSQFKKNVTSKYAKVFSPGHLSDISLGYGWPYQYQIDPNKPLETDNKWLEEIKVSNFDSDSCYEVWRKREIPLSLIAGNKVSPYKEENYRIRRRIAHEVDSTLLKVFGPQWKSPVKSKVWHRLATVRFALINRTIPNLRSIYGDLHWKYNAAIGFIDNKHEVLENTKFAIVVENSNTYVSEKLFDALVNRCIPIYVGPKLVEMRLPSGIAIESKGNPKDIVEIYKETEKRHVLNILIEIEKFLKSKDFYDNWTEFEVYRKIARDISDRFNSSY